MNDSISPADLVEQNSTDEAVAIYNTKENRSNIDADYVVPGRTTISEPEQKVREYKIRFVYYPETQAEIEKFTESNHNYDATTGIATKIHTLQAKRLPAAYRQAAIGYILPICDSLGIYLSDDGAIFGDEKNIVEQVTNPELIKNTIKLAALVFGYNEDAISSADSLSLIEFVVDFMTNEQNIVEEAFGFLSQQQKQQKS